MCVVSMIQEHYVDKWKHHPGFPNPQPYRVYPPQPIPWEPDFDKKRAEFEKQFIPFTKPAVPPITREEIEEFRRLLKRAREYDKRNNEPHCENVVKQKVLRDLIEAAGYDASFLIDTDPADETA